jgi:hypothetical protein
MDIWKMTDVPVTINQTVNAGVTIRVQAVIDGFTTSQHATCTVVDGAAGTLSSSLIVGQCISASNGPYVVITNPTAAPIVIANTTYTFRFMIV